MRYLWIIALVFVAGCRPHERNNWDRVKDGERPTPERTMTLEECDCWLMTTRGVIGWRSRPEDRNGQVGTLCRSEDANHIRDSQP